MKLMGADSNPETNRTRKAMHSATLRRQSPVRPHASSTAVAAFNTAVRCA